MTIFNKILWATDGSAASDAALPVVTAMAGSEGAGVVVFHSEQRLTGPRTYGYPVYADEEQVKEKIQRQATQLGDAGIAADLDIAAGNPGVGAAHDIAAAADRHGADLIIVATRGHTAVGGLLLGSVTQRLLHVANSPVLVVPVKARESVAESSAHSAEARR